MLFKIKRFANRTFYPWTYRPLKLRTTAKTNGQRCRTSKTTGKTISFILPTIFSFVVTAVRFRRRLQFLTGETSRGRNVSETNYWNVLGAIGLRPGGKTSNGRTSVIPTSQMILCHLASYFCQFRLNVAKHKQAEYFILHDIKHKNSTSLDKLFAPVSRAYTVSQKNIPDIFDCNVKKDYRILIISGTNIPGTTCRKVTI